MIIQAVERLREDAQKLLLSRKRKLAELYDSTVCRIGRAHSTPNDVYYRQLQAFQDANDLQKGRLFVESSLPSRQESSQPSTKTTPPPALQSGTNLKQNARNSESPSAAASQVSNRGSVLPGSRHTTPQPDTVLRSNSKQSRTHTDLSSKPVESPADNTPSVSPATGVQQIQPAATEDGDIPTADPGDGGSLPHPPPHHESVQEIKRSPTIPPPLETHDAQSSPTSSRDRPPSHTPGPDAASPTTSPGDDTLPTLEIMNTNPPEQRKDEPQTPDMIAAPTHKMSISSIDVDMIDVDPSPSFDSPVQPAKSSTIVTQDSKQDKPSISIDTQTQAKSYFEGGHNSNDVNTPASLPQQDSVKHTPVSTPAVDSARRATRIQSGVLLKKSVSEILGGTPRPASPATESSALGAASRAADKDRKEKERSRLSTVVFAKPQRPISDPDTIEVARIDQTSKELSHHGERDYMYTLFESKAHSQSRQGSMTYLLQHSHKTISTTDHLVDYHYQAHCRVLKRLYQLQNLDRWSLRQRKRAEEPVRPTSHWDFLLDHAKWMRTDFREERRWKLAAARAVAEACAEWVVCDPEERLQLQVRRRPHPYGQDVDMVKELDLSVPSPPELDPPGEDDSVSEDIADPRDIMSAVAPAAIFSLGANEFTFSTEKTPAFDKLINELPLYKPAKIEPDLSKSNLAEKLDARWKTDIVSASRYATENLKIRDFKPPIRRSRYDYDVDDSPPSKRQALEPRETGVALFMPENKHIRDRIHPGHAFRPPAEHPMPSQAFFETRMSSQWLSAEDDEVRRQAREYSFNWTLISELMMPSTLYTSGQDRRTAWECFERWIGLEGMPADMAKTPYFKTYSNRIETAQRNVQSQWEEHERRNGTAPVSNRRKTTLPVRVERKHNRRHLFMLDAMRKLAKKREVARQKATHSADVAAMRKNNDVHAQRPSANKTPAEWSQIKYDREQKLIKQNEMYKQQIMAHQRANMQPQRQGPNANMNGGPVPGPVPPNGHHQMRVPMPMPPNGSLQVPNGQPRPHPSMMGMPGMPGMPPNPMVMPMGVSKPMVQPGMPRGMAGSPQQVQQTQAGQVNGGYSSPRVPQAAMANGQVPNNAAYMGMTPNGPHGSPTNVGSHASPRAQPHVQSLSNGSMPKINQLFATIRERNPALTDEEVKGIASQQLINWQQTQATATVGVSRPKINQAALNAARGAANAAQQSAMTMNSMNAMSYEQAQQYHQRMRLQQSQAMPRNNAPPGPTASMSPMLNVARPSSQHSQMSVPGNNNVNRDQRSTSVSTNINNNAPVIPPVSTPTGDGQQQINGGQPAPMPT